MPPTASQTERRALLAAVSCFTLWGLLPLLFQGVGRAGGGSIELVSWRVLASAPLVAVFVLGSGQAGALVALLRQPRLLGALTVSSLLIGVNWGVYVLAVQHGQTLAASLGYYINPLINVVFGALLFRERLGLAALVAVGLATVGVALDAWATGGPPWIALTLAGVFGAYGVIRKVTPVEPQTGLMVETLILTVPAALALVWLSHHGGGAFGRNPAATWLLLASGPATVVPLLTFTVAARRLPLSMLGFLQFIQPTILFGLGVQAGEAVDALRLGSFGFIWLGVAIFVFDAWRRSQRREPAVA